VDAAELLREGNLGAALDQLKAEVRSAPGDVRKRIFLFQLLAIVGDWEKSMTQLHVAGDLDAGTLGMVQTYREALRCEVLREAVFAGQRSPLIFGEPERWIALVFEALRQASAGQHGDAERLRAEAFEAAPATAGTIDGVPFEWIADADARIGPFLEVIVDGKYYWVPFHRINHIKTEPPADLRDLVWLPGEFTWANGGQSVGLIPVRYPGTTADGDDRQRLARSTDWQLVSDGTYAGLGQRLLATDGGEYSLLEVRELRCGSGSGPDADG
jgi:type VI secretion system protein ImpE